MMELNMVCRGKGGKITSLVHIYRVSHPLDPLDSVMFLLGVARFAKAVGSCRASPPAGRNFVKTSDKIYRMSGWETRYMIQAM